MNESKWSRMKIQRRELEIEKELDKLMHRFYMNYDPSQASRGVSYAMNAGG